MAVVKQLADVFQPENYNLYFEIDRETKTIVGRTIITGEASTTDVKLHQNKLHVKSVFVNDIATLFLVVDDEIRITVPAVGKVRLTIDYETVLTDDMVGIYSAVYQEGGETKRVVGTHFEPAFARQAFPAIDEPGAKATFELAIKYDERPGEMILANMPEQQVVAGVHYFAKTAPMATYLLAFAFGEFHGITTQTATGVEVGVFATTAHATAEMTFALDIAKRSIEFYEDYYQTAYPLPKSWQLALPNFSAGAMENWGLVMYREAFLLLDPDNSSLTEKQSVATVIAHELAHQWFGDLVTMQWWDDLWLNESFANMMQYVAIDALEPDWHIWQLFLTDDVPLALNRDAIDGVQPIHVTVADPTALNALFDDAIVYAKGSRMLVMVRMLLGDAVLRNGLKIYFAQHAYRNAIGDDLWAALASSSGIAIGELMATWLNQPGYPLVTASVEAGDLILSQQQFFIGDHNNDKRLWQIPLHSNYAAVPELLTEQRIVVGDYAQLRRENQGPLLVNMENGAHFIVAYDTTLWDDIQQHLQTLRVVDKAQLLQDQRLLLAAQLVPAQRVVPLLLALSDDKHSLIKHAMNQVVATLRMFVAEGTVADKRFRRLVNQLSASEVTRLGLSSRDGETFDDSTSRPIMLEAAVTGENDATIVALHRVFVANNTHLANISSDIRRVVLVNEVLNFWDTLLFDYLMAEYMKARDANYRADISAAVARSRDLTAIAQVLRTLKNGAVIKPQELRSWYGDLIANEAAEQATWDWLRENWQWLSETVGGEAKMNRYIRLTAQTFKTRKRLIEFQSFFEPKRVVPVLQREIQVDEMMIKGRVSLVDTSRQLVNDAIADAR